MTRYTDTQVSTTGRVEVELSDGNGHSVKSFEPQVARQMALDVLFATHEAEAATEQDNE